MRRAALLFLLTLSLVCNGLAAPFAMGHGSVPAQHDHGRSTAKVTEHAGHGHAHHGGADSPALEQAPELPPSGQSDASCCNGTTCQCGCVLPPILTCTPIAMIAHVVAVAPEVAVMQAGVTRAATPPFRPPAA